MDRFWSLFLKMAVVCSLLLAIAIRGCAGDGPDFQKELQTRMKHVEANPRDAVAHFQLGWLVVNLGMNTPMTIERLKNCLGSEFVDKPLHEVLPAGAFAAAHLIGRSSANDYEYNDAAKYLELAFEYSKQNNGGSGDLCTNLLLATNLNAYPMSNQDADESIASVEKWATILIDNERDDLKNDWLTQGMPGYAPDPFVHCQLTLFTLSFYYRADVAKIANFYYQMSVLVWPKLLYTAQHVKDFDVAQQQLKRSLTNESPGATPLIQTCVDRKIKLGVIAATLTSGHSVAEDFGGILQRLDRDIFEVSYHFIQEKYVDEMPASFLTANPSDKIFYYRKASSDNSDGAWLRRWGKELEEFKFDMILYPDLTMSTYSRRLAMERLAPVQINTHGHPITSGIPKHTVQHFVSWAEAELPIEESQTHYTEELQLIPKGKIHQYYTSRFETGPGGKLTSRFDNLPFEHITREWFKQLPESIQNSSPDDEDIHLYVCMQKPFKLFPEFDELVCGILRDDPEGHAVLHEETRHSTKFIQRLQNAGCDMERVHFLPAQRQSMLAALYLTATVILDSYPAGGCTTSREALELGKAIVTWPARLLGGRWTLGLYNAIGLDADTQSKVIASSKEEYIAKAVELGTNKSLRKDVEKKILEAAPNLFGREEAVEEWEKILLKISPVKQCKDAESNATDDETKPLLDKDEL